jgi:hypothetical protein
VLLPVNAFKKIVFSLREIIEDFFVLFSEDMSSTGLIEDKVAGFTYKSSSKKVIEDKSAGLFPRKVFKEVY